MNKIIILLVIVNLLFGFLIIHKNRESFQVTDTNQRYMAYFADIINTNEYDTDLLGPTCLSKCIRQFGARLNFTNCEGHYNPVDWSKAHPTKGYCYRANNNTEYPFVCDEDCQNKCGKDLNLDEGNIDLSTYNPDKDFSHCEFDTEQNICVEKNLNMISGGGCEITSGCRQCINNNWNNLENMYTIVTTALRNGQDQCETR